MFTSDIPKVRFSTPFVEYIPVPPRSSPPSSVAHASANICRMHRNLCSNIRSLARSLFSASWLKLRVSPQRPSPAQPLAERAPLSHPALVGRTPPRIAVLGLQQTFSNCVVRSRSFRGISCAPKVSGHAVVLGQSSPNLPSPNTYCSAGVRCPPTEYMLCVFPA